jgi:hypothetical protein
MRQEDSQRRGACVGRSRPLNAPFPKRALDLLERWRDERSCIGCFAHEVVSE